MQRITRFLVFFCLLMSLLTAPVIRATPMDYDQGRVNMQGAIIDTTCAIDAGSRDQAIDMGVVPVSSIARDGQGRTRYFVIELINCAFDRSGSESRADKKFQVSFDGDVDSGLFGVRGKARGVALQITDSLGNIAMPGSPVAVSDRVAETMMLSYAIKLVSNNKPLRAGDYFSVVRFKLSYY